MAKHRSEDILQQGQDMLIGLKETSHLLQLHYSWVWSLRNYIEKIDRAREKRGKKKNKAKNEKSNRRQNTRGIDSD